MKNILHKITIDCSTIRTEKPSNDIIKYDIHYNLKTRFEFQTVLELTNQIISNGFTWSPTIFKNNYRVGTDWESQSLFVLDFDNGITPEEILERFNRVNITPNLIYSTFNDSPQLRKFRVVLFLNDIITNRKERDKIQKSLMLMFPECDPACKDAVRMFLGGKQIIFSNELLIPINHLKEVLNGFIISNDKNQTRYTFELSSQQCLESFYYYNYKTDNDTYINIVKQRLTLSESENIDFIPKTKHNLNLDIAKQNVKIFKDFLDGKWLYHNQLFGLATNLKYINNGLTLFKETMIKYNNLGTTNYTPNNFAIIPQLQKDKHYYYWLL